MKSILKTLLCLLTAICILFALVACGSSKTETAQESAPAAPAAADAQAPTAEASAFKIMGDVFAYESMNKGNSETKYVYVFEKDGIVYRAVADLPADVSETIWSLDFIDENYDEKVREAVAPLPIVQLDNLTELIPAQAELDALVGKTGQELKDEGWTISGWQLDDMEFTLEHGPFAYTVIMEGDYTPNANYDFDEEADFPPLKVKSITYAGIGDATSEILDADMEAAS